VHKLEDRRPVRRADNLTTFTCRLSIKYGNLNLPEPSEPVNVIPLLQIMMLNYFNNKFLPHMNAVRLNYKE